MMPDEYKGVPLEELRIDEIVWSEERARHIRTRSMRSGTSEHDLEPEWATEAALDTDRLVALAATAEDPDNQALRVLGYSPNVPPNGAVLKVWLWSDNPTASSSWNGGSAAIAGDSARRRYEEARSKGGANDGS